MYDPRIDLFPYKKLKKEKKGEKPEELPLLSINF